MPKKLAELHAGALSDVMAGYDVVGGTCHTGDAPSGYTSLGNGVCRGKDGFNDMVNARANTGFASEAGCAAACDAVPAGEGICAGFAWQSNDENECILYGPGMAGAAVDARAGAGGRCRQA